LKDRLKEFTFLSRRKRSNKNFDDHNTTTFNTKTRLNRAFDYAASTFVSQELNLKSLLLSFVG